jgi:dTDP-4-dehydrorhamnose reductase
VASRLVAQGARVVLLSTSAVFDCREPTMLADRPYAPRGVYGSQKALAEAHFLALGPLASVLRLTKVLAPGPGLLSDWNDALSHLRPIRAFADVRISPLKVRNVTDALVAIAEHGEAGIYQASGAGDVSYAEIAYRLVRELRVSESLVESRLATESGIPSDEVTPYTSLDASRLVRLIGFQPPAPFAVIDEVFGRRTNQCLASVLNKQGAQ